MKIIAGNWKMNGTRALARGLCEAARRETGAEVILFPPFTLLAEVAATGVKTGGQDCHAEVSGAFTGDVSAAMLKEAGGTHVIVGHSERRQGHGETSETVREKAARALETGLIPIICVGEPLDIREQKQAEAFTGAQAKASVPEGAIAGDFLLAYEPVWAIGTGLTPSLEDIQAMHLHLKNIFPGARVLYGGSVKAANAREILALDAVDGALVGGASLQVEEFTAIIRAS